MSKSKAKKHEPVDPSTFITRSSTGMFHHGKLAALFDPNNEGDQGYLDGSVHISKMLPILLEVASTHHLLDPNLVHRSRAIEYSFIKQIPADDISICYVVMANGRNLLAAYAMALNQAVFDCMLDPSLHTF